MGTTQYQEESGNTGNFTSAEQAEKIKRLDELISKSKEEKAVYDGRIPSINKRTSRALRDEENYITKVGEFKYENGTPVKANMPYHIHYTTLLEEVYMTEYSHKAKLSKIIVPLKIKTNFQYYNSLNKQTPLKIKGSMINPTFADYQKGFYTRYFAKNASDEHSSPFEVDLKNYLKSALYTFVQVKWHLSGPEESVYVRNANEIQKAQKTISNIDKILPRMQFYRYDRSLNPKQLSEQKLGIFVPVGEEGTSGESTETSTQASGYSAASGGPPPGFGGY